MSLATTTDEVALAFVAAAPLRHEVRRLHAPWTVHGWSTDGAGPLVRTDGAVTTVLLGEPDSGPDLAVGRTEVQLEPDGTVTVRTHCSPPAVHVLAAGGHALVPAAGGESGSTLVGPGEVVVVSSCALLERAPAAVAALTGLLARGVGPELAERAFDAVDAVLSDAELSADAPAAALVVVVNDPARWPAICET